MSIIGRLCNDGPIHLLPCSYPDSRLINIAMIGSINKIDKNPCRVLIAYYEHPKKAASEEFYEWLKMYRNETDSVLNCQSSTTVYADSGVRTTASRNKEGASVYSLCRGDDNGGDYILAEDSFKCGLATPFDAKISAALAGIKKAVELIERDFKHEAVTAPTWHKSKRYSRCLVLCMDNQAASLSILSGSLKIEHAPAICASTIIRHFLDLHPRHYFVAM
jgi:hypothetical protein